MHSFNWMKGELVNGNAVNNAGFPYCSLRLNGAWDLQVQTERLENQVHSRWSVLQFGMMLAQQLITDIDELGFSTTVMRYG